MNRASNWQVTLSEYISQQRTAPFVWGENDCALFACNCINVMTGVDTAAWFRGKYNDKIGAYRALRDFAGGGLAETADKLTGEHGLEEVPRLMAQRGDLVLCEHRDEDALGIIDFTGRGVMITGEKGLLTLPVQSVKRAWRV